MDRFRSLTARLVLTAVALVALVCLLIADRHDPGDARATSSTSWTTRSVDGRRADADRPARARATEPGRFRRLGSLARRLPGRTATNGYVIVAQGDDAADREDLVRRRQLAELDDVPADGEAHDVDVDGLGDYRVSHRGHLRPDGTVRGRGGPADRRRRRDHRHA